MTAILGISAYFHDSAAALVVDGKIVAAAQEERFSRVKHDRRFPEHAIDYCLAEAGLRPADLDYVGFYEKPLAKFDRLLETFVAFAPNGFRLFRHAIPDWLHHKLHLPRELKAGLRNQYLGRFVFTEHHESHAASAFFPSPFDEAAIVTMDGVGEWATGCIGTGRGNRIELTHELRFPHSLGLLYSAFTQYTGFRVDSGEYKVMGLAPFGEPIYKDLILERLMDLKEDGSFQLNMSYFHYCRGLTMTSHKFHRLFGGPPRKPESAISERHMNLAASIQAVAEEVMLRIVRWTHRQTGQRNLVMAGGVALNCVANGRIAREGPFEQLWIQPAAGDAGGALGNALFIWHQLLEKPRQPCGVDSQQSSFLGPLLSDAEIGATLAKHTLSSRRADSDQELCELVADSIAQEKIVGWFQGRMEFGPRALGARSILADARSPRMQSVLNRKIKFRESFRPFAPIVLREYADQYFDVKPGDESPYMMLVADVRHEQRVAESSDRSNLGGIDRVHECRSTIPAVTHIDYTARLQTVDECRNPLLHRLLTTFYERTGCPVMINTSFNVRGEPIVCTPEDAIRCFQATEMDVLVMGRHVLTKDNTKHRPDTIALKAHLTQFQLD